MDIANLRACTTVTVTGSAPGRPVKDSVAEGDAPRELYLARDAP